MRTDDGFSADNRGARGRTMGGSREITLAGLVDHPVDARNWRSQALAVALLSLGLRKGDRVATLC